MSDVAPTEFDIVLAARSMILVYGSDAAAEAAKRAEADWTSSAIWKRILAVIERLQSEQPASVG
jgi:hypothetical protein